MEEKKRENLLSSLQPKENHGSLGELKEHEIVRMTSQDYSLEQLIPSRVSGGAPPTVWVSLLYVTLSFELIVNGCNATTDNLGADFLPSSRMRSSH